MNLISALEKCATKQKQVNKSIIIVLQLFYLFIYLFTYLFIQVISLNKNRFAGGL